MKDNDANENTLKSLFFQKVRIFLISLKKIHDYFLNSTQYNFASIINSIV